MLNQPSSASRARSDRVNPRRSGNAGVHVVCHDQDLPVHARRVFRAPVTRSRNAVIDRHTAVSRDDTDIHRRLDAQARYALAHDVAQQIPVVAGDLHRRMSSAERRSRLTASATKVFACCAQESENDENDGCSAVLGQTKAGICSNRQFSHSRRCSGNVGSARSSSPGVRNLVQRGVAPRSRHFAVVLSRRADNATGPTQLEQCPRVCASRHTEPGPRRGHTAARTFRGGPVQLAHHAIQLLFAQRGHCRADWLDLSSCRPPHERCWWRPDSELEAVMQACFCGRTPRVGRIEARACPCPQRAPPCRRGTSRCLPTPATANWRPSRR